MVSGEVIPLEEVEDQVFSQKVMGDGIAIRPLDSVIQAPADGTVTVVMKETAHACGLTLDNGMELLIHVGIDTVELGGEGFEMLAEEGQSVTCGTPLIRFDRQKIKEAGYQDTVMLIVTGEGDAKEIRMQTGMQAEAGKTTIISYQ